MKSKTFDCKSFLHEYFKIPRHRKTTWCIIEEIVKDECTLRLGLMLCGTNLYLDIARRRFFTQGRIGNVRRTIYPAIRRSASTNWVYCAPNNGFTTLTLPKSYIADIYYPAIFDKYLLKDQLY